MAGDADKALGLTKTGLIEVNFEVSYDDNDDDAERFKVRLGPGKDPSD